ncbi:lysylphosphatidylglycerol synthase transmembrane domain-containing protein [Thermocoleostomius sinensis]|uniref:Lysylphosphatidylglycerol synthase transmembrane domain-containing protein n=1 Tax=Thermocoleostomius sinensis A174 TaxID=2016057 RepID=A0A9E9C573_9CYAN|nr:lysylphosphatidylglycerol synthase transmembrane domain-containing protein [Thermocoleostomius sinensis]WAL60811.1 lysylphosphatidylglycerol synthase transmembrane domain-containing protein [Thermocoleostomius sinensis A174]
MKRLISILVSLIILLFIYWKIDFDGLIQVLRNCDRLWMAISLGMVIPITMLTAWRLQQLMPNSSPASHPPQPPASLAFAEANKLILAASSLNMVLPSKMGDIAKAYFMQDRGHLTGSLALSLVVFEKTCDMLSLLLWCVFGLLLYPQKDVLFWGMTFGVTVGLLLGLAILCFPKFARSFFALVQSVSPKKLRAKLGKMSFAWQEMHDYFWRDKQHLLKLALTSIFIWFLHLLQIWFFILALNAYTPFLTNLALSPLAILAGLLPLTFAGVGTRDAALILFYQPYFDAATGAALGVLCTSRYFLPAIGGLPFLQKYLNLAKRSKPLA